MKPFSRVCNQGHLTTTGFNERKLYKNGTIAVKPKGRIRFHVKICGYELLIFLEKKLVIEQILQETGWSRSRKRRNRFGSAPASTQLPGSVTLITSFIKNCNLGVVLFSDEEPELH